MAVLYDKSNQVITNYVTAVVPRPDVIDLKNRLLDGKYHLQNIGTAATVVSVSAVVTCAGKVLLDTAKETASQIKVTGNNKYYQGVIDEYSVDPISPVYYRVNLTILQQTGGDI